MQLLHFISKKANRSGSIWVKNAIHVDVDVRHDTASRFLRDIRNLPEFEQKVYDVRKKGGNELVANPSKIDPNNFLSGAQPPLMLRNYGITGKRSTIPANIDDRSMGRIDAMRRAQAALDFPNYHYTIRGEWFGIPF